jgi:hypothetical protein
MCSDKSRRITFRPPVDSYVRNINVSLCEALHLKRQDAHHLGTLFDGPPSTRMKFWFLS